MLSVRYQTVLHELHHDCMSDNSIMHHQLACCHYVIIVSLVVMASGQNCSNAPEKSHFRLRVALNRGWHNINCACFRSFH